MKELFKIEYKVKVNGEYKEVVTTATDLILREILLTYKQYNTGEVLQQYIRDIKDLKITML